MSDKADCLFENIEKFKLKQEKLNSDIKWQIAQVEKLKFREPFITDEMMESLLEELTIR